jgi:hypothetical protein
MSQCSSCGKPATRACSKCGTYCCEDVVLLRGAVELKAALLDKESQRPTDKTDKGM